MRHKLRTDGSRSPMQLYILSMLRIRGSDLTAAREMYEPQTEVHVHVFLILSYLTERLTARVSQSKTYHVSTGQFE